MNHGTWRACSTLPDTHSVGAERRVESLLEVHYEELSYLRETCAVINWTTGIHFGFHFFKCALCKHLLRALWPFVCRHHADDLLQTALGNAELTLKTQDEVIEKWREDAMAQGSSLEMNHSFLQTALLNIKVIRQFSVFHMCCGSFYHPVSHREWKTYCHQENKKKHRGFIWWYSACSVCSVYKLKPKYNDSLSF